MVCLSSFFMQGGKGDAGTTGDAGQKGAKVGDE